MDNDKRLRCYECEADYNARISALESQLREREAELSEKTAWAKGFGHEWKEKILEREEWKARAESAEAALAAARDELAKAEKHAGLLAREITVRNRELAALRSRADDAGRVIIETIVGVEGTCVSINDIRVAGPKPWGGGTVRDKWIVPVATILSALHINAERLIDWRCECGALHLKAHVGMMCPQCRAVLAAADGREP